VPATIQDRHAVAALLGREPTADFDVVVRRRGRGSPVVIRNAPFTRGGTPMPTRYWLVDADWNGVVSRLEAAGGVRDAEAEVDPTVLARAHGAYAADRDAAVDPAREGPRPFGGVGGTRVGVKCLHAHAAWRLVGGADPVGDWVLARVPPELVADTVVVVADPGDPGAGG
jgi:hypothetical protein